MSAAPVRLAQEMLGPPGRPGTVWCEAIERPAATSRPTPRRSSAGGLFRLVPLRVGFHRGVDTLHRPRGHRDDRGAAPDQ